MYLVDATPARHTQSVAAYAGMSGPAINFAYQAMGLCCFGVMFGNPTLLSDFTNTVTGWDLTQEDLLTIANRIVAIRQAFNIGEGWKPSDYKYPDRTLARAKRLLGS